MTKMHKGDKRQDQAAKEEFIYTENRGARAKMVETPI